MRAAWGCDAEARSTVWESTCQACFGGTPGCERCKGRGRVRHMRCPSSMATPEGRHVVRLLGHYRCGFLPASGGILDQPAKLLFLLDLAAGEVARIEEHERESSDRKG